jgi:DNA-binding XRE family transcriptional regulator
LRNQRRSTGGRPRDKAPPGYVTVRQAADYFGVSEQAIRNRIRDGALPAKEARREGTRERRYYVPESALVDGTTAEEAPMSAREATLAAKDETIAELRQRVTSLEHHLETLENLLAAALDRSVEQPAPLDENEDVSGDKKYVSGTKKSYVVDGAKVRRLREERFWTQEQLAKTAHLSPQRLSEIERRGGGINVSTLRSLAATLGVSPRDLKTP